MNQTTHKTLAALLKVIKAEDNKQFAVVIDYKEDGTKEYVLSRPYKKDVEEKE